ncbi:hypothetical protein ACRYI5_05305 [Furfurilactobacillus sp. WILCCON 0119]|uniref:hypothetical protein n=1 Tax=Furfurilactobacillus entadae TaxID=2922307 RepID=UPI0035EBE2C8
MHIKDGKQRFIWLIISILLNSAFNALTVATNMGSAVWTASAVNLAHWVMHTTNPAVASQALGLVLTIYGIVVAFLDLLLIGRFDGLRLIRNILFVVPFSYLIQFIVPFWSNVVGIKYLHGDFAHPWQLALLMVINIIGLFGVGAAVSLYQRANLIMHPNDDLSYIIRFRYLKGLATASQMLSYIPPITIMLICFFVNGHQLWAVNFGTVWAFLTQGWVQGWSDRHFIPSLKHHFAVKRSVK